MGLFRRDKSKLNASGENKRPGPQCEAPSTPRVIMHKKGELFPAKKATSFTETWSSTACAFIPVYEDETGFSPNDLPPLDGSICPRCLGADRRPTADHGFLCTSPIARRPVTAVIPPGMAGNVNAIPLCGDSVFVECGSYYTEEESREFARHARTEISLRSMQARSDRQRQKEIAASRSPVERAVRQLARYAVISDQELQVEGGRKVLRPRNDLARSQILLFYRECPDWPSRHNSTLLCDSAIARWFANGDRERIAASNDRAAGRHSWRVPGSLVDPPSIVERPDALIDENGTLNIDGSLSDAAVLWLAGQRGIAVQWDSNLLRLS